MSLQGGYTDFKQIFLLSVSIQTHILWYPGPYNWLALFLWMIFKIQYCHKGFSYSRFFYHAEFLLASPRIFFLVTLRCFSSCKRYCVTLACVNSSSWSLPFVWKASTRTACWKSAKILLWELDTSWKTPALLLWDAGNACHPHSLQALFPPHPTPHPM